LKHFDRDANFEKILVPVTLTNENTMIFSCLFQKGKYNILKFEKASVSPGNEAKSWVYQPDA
jgi:hypothetical protein